MNVENERLAVFSEMYYPKGWNAFLDGKPILYHKVNYMLRGVVLPAGSHELIFRFEPVIIRTGTVLMGSGWLLFGIIILLGFRSYKIKY